MNPDRSHRWLSRGAEVLAQEVAAAPNEMHCDVLIVGSGYGGAVAAARLAGARPTAGGEALRVIVLERGNEYLPGEFPATFAELPGHVRFSQQDGKAAHGRRTGLFDLRLGKDVNVLLGNGLGGGSLINAAVMERASADAFPDGAWPAGIDATTLEPWYSKALAMLEPETIPHPPAKLLSLLAAGKKMGAYEGRKAYAAVAFADGTTKAGVAVSECLQCGDCVSGCNHGAKKSLDVNYLARAQAIGAQLFCGGTVTRLRALESTAGYEVEFFLTDPTKARSDTRPYLLRAVRVILAAGSLGSTEILLRSAELPMARDWLGQRFSTNGDLIAVAYGQHKPAHSCTDEGVPPRERKVGPTITGLLRKAQENARPLVIEEFAIPAPLYRLLGEVVTTTGALHGLFDNDTSVHRPGEKITDPQAVNAALLDKTPVYGMMGDDGAGGQLVLPDGDERCDAQIAIQWSAVRNLPLFDAQMSALRDAHESQGGCGGRVLPNPMWRLFPPLDKVTDVSLPLGPVFTVHPLGGCGMAEDKTAGVVDSAGRVFGAGEHTTLPGLVVLDGAIVPVSLGINPSLTIAALAERALPLLAYEWKITLDPTPVPQAAPRPRRRDLTQPRTPADTRFTLHERITGRLTIVGDDRQARPFDVSVLIDFDAAEIRRLRQLPRTIGLARVEITLTDPTNQQSWTLHCEGRAEVLVREHSNVHTRVTNALGPARRRLARWAPFRSHGNGFGRLRALLALCSHLGAVRLIRYSCKVTRADKGAPLGEGAELQLTKRVAFTDSGNPWRQLSEGVIERVDGCNVELGTLSTDLSYFVEQLVPLLQIERQQDAPNALGDLAELALWILRAVLHIHLLNLLPAADDFDRSRERMPGAVDDVEPEPMDLPQQRGGSPVRKLSLYRSRTPTVGARPVLLIHGYGASGSTFTHSSIGTPLVASLLRAGRHVWVVELRTSIALPENKTLPWPFDVVASEDVADAVRTVRDYSGQGLDGRVDVVAHCVGAAMFSVAVLSSDDLHRNIGCVVLSQVGPLVSGSPMNRFRAFVAAYLQQYLGVQWFDVRPITSPTTVLVDAILNTFPYPDGDGEAERLRALPGFAAVRHRADAIFGQTMRLSNIGDDTLRALDAIYGFVSVPGLAQVGHYVAQHVLTDGLGQNQTVEFERLATRFNFPLLMLHGRHNGVFDWRGSYRAMYLLKQVFDKALVSPLPPEMGPDGLYIGDGTPRQLRVLGKYGHQDTLIGEHAHRDVFPHITKFLDEFKKRAPSKRQGIPPLVARWPATGPTLGAVSFAKGGEILRCRLALRPPRGHASTLAVALIPAMRNESGWHFDLDLLVAVFLEQRDLIEKALVLALNASQVPNFQGFAVVTVHTDLPLRLQRSDVLLTESTSNDGLFNEPSQQLSPSAREAVEKLLADKVAAERAVVRLDPGWIAAVPAPNGPPGPLCFALASCQYPAGLFDAVPAQGSYDRLAARLDAAPGAMRPQLLMLAGDQAYVDETAGLFAMPGADGVDRAYEVNHRLEAYRRVTRSLPTYVLLDDHEVSDDWEPPPPVPGALDAYVQRQHKLVEATTQPPFHYALAPAGLPFFALDTRSTRDPRTLREYNDAAVLADAQIADAQTLRKLAMGFAKLPALLPKFILSPVALFPLQRAAVFGHPAERIGIDDWGGYPRSQLELLTFVRDHPLRTLVLLSGDRHMSSVSSLWLQGQYGDVEVISIVASGLYAPWPFANARPDEYWLDGSFETGDGSLCGRMETPLIGSADGFALIKVAAGEDGIWTLDVTLDLAEGARSASRRLDGRPDGHWQVPSAPGPMQ